MINNYSGIPSDGLDRDGRPLIGGVPLPPPIDSPAYYYTLPTSARQLAGCYNPGGQTAVSAATAAPGIWSLARTVGVTAAAANSGALPSAADGALDCRQPEMLGQSKVCLGTPMH